MTRENKIERSALDWSELVGRVVRVRLRARGPQSRTGWYVGIVRRVRAGSGELRELTIQRPGTATGRSDSARCNGERLRVEARELELVRFRKRWHEPRAFLLNRKVRGPAS